MKKMHIEITRIIAMLLVIFNHTGSKGYFYFSRLTASLDQWIYLFISISCKVAVPLFFMISGALLLGKEESWKNVFKKRVLHYGSVLIVFSIIYYYFSVYFKGMEPKSIKQFVVSVYTEPMVGSLWYLYSYISIMLMLPLLRRLVQTMKEAEYIYLAGMSILFTGIVPFMEYMLFQGEHTMYRELEGALFSSTYIVYFIMRYYFEHIMPDRYYNKKYFVAAIVLSIVAILATAYLTLYRAEVTGILDEKNSQKYHSILIAIPSYTIYVSMKMFLGKVDWKDKTKKLISCVGGTMFGVYLLEHMLRHFTLPLFDIMRSYISTFPACCVWVLIVFVIGVAIVLLLKRIPIIKKMF